MTIANGIEELWIARYEMNRSGYPEMLADHPFDGWERSHMPETRVEEELSYGLYIAYAWGSDHEQAVAFFNRACVVAERAIDEDKLTSPLSNSSFPLNRGILNRAFSYARAALGEPLDSSALRQASQDFEEWCKGYGRRDWDSQAQANYLAAVRLALVAGDLERARELLKTKKSFKWHNEEHQIWFRLVERDRAIDDALAESFDRYFGRLRDPGFVPDVYMEIDILRIELAAVRDKYLVSDDGKIDWWRAIDSIPGRARDQRTE